jgi:hypothetical protein
VLIRRGDAEGNDGFASIGRAPGATLELNRRLGTGTREQRNYVAALLAHELGHVLGLDHTAARGCQAMDAVIGVDGCPTTRQAWRYRCRIVYADDVAGAIHLYGGRPARLGPLFCDLEAPPPQLLGVAFSGGEEAGQVVRISWRRPAGLRRDARIDVSIFALGHCGDRSASVGGTTLPSSATSWRDEEAADRPPGRYCYRIQVYSRLGRTQPPLSRVLGAYVVPPAEPIVGTLREWPDEQTAYTVELQLPTPGSRLEVVHGPRGSCPASPFDPALTPLGSTPGSAGAYLVFNVPEGAGCLSFFAVKDGRASKPVTREIVHGPPPPPPPPPPEE